MENKEYIFEHIPPEKPFSVEEAIKVLMSGHIKEKGGVSDE